MLWRGLKTACYNSLMHIDHFLKDVDQWQSHNPVCCCFVCTICEVDIGVDESIFVLTIAEHIARCDSVAVEMFALRTDYYSGTYTHISQNFSEW